MEGWKKEPPPTPAPIFHEWSTATADLAVLPGVLGCSFDVGTCPERSEGGQAHLATYRLGTPQVQRPAVARWPVRLA